MSRVPKKYQWLLSPYNYPKLKCIEPVKRKHGNTYPEWQCHRFPIKGGISWRDVLIMEWSKPNPWLKCLSDGLKTPDRKWFTLKGPTL